MTDTAPPALVALDLELASPVELGPCFMADALAAGPGVVCGARVDRRRVHDLLADRCTVGELERWAAALAGVGVVTWNGLSFDLPILDAWLSRLSPLAGGAAPQAGRLMSSAGWARHVDLCALATLISAGVTADELRDNPPTATWWRHYPRPARARRPGGWKLTQVGIATLGRGKRGMTGAEAPRAWQRGELDVVIDYCRWDTALTRALYLHAWAGEPLISGRGERVEIPRDLLR